MTIETIIFYFLLADSITANLFALFGQSWYSRHWRLISRWFPLAGGWVLYYLILMLWVGSLLYRMGALGF